MVPVWCLYLKLMPVSLQHSQLCTLLTDFLTDGINHLCLSPWGQSAQVCFPQPLLEKWVNWVSVRSSWLGGERSNPKESAQVDVMGPSVAKKVLNKRKHYCAQCHEVVNHSLSKARHSCSEKSSSCLNLCLLPQWLSYAFALASGQALPVKCISLEESRPALLTEMSSWSSTRRGCQQTKGFSSISH